MASPYPVAAGGWEADAIDPAAQRAADSEAARLGLRGVIVVEGNLLPGVPTLANVLTEVLESSFSKALGPNHHAPQVRVRPGGGNTDLCRQSDCGHPFRFSVHPPREMKIEPLTDLLQMEVEHSGTRHGVVFLPELRALLSERAEGCGTLRLLLSADIAQQASARVCPNVATADTEACAGRHGAPENCMPSAGVPSAEACLRRCSGEPKEQCGKAQSNQPKHEENRVLPTAVGHKSADWFSEATNIIPGVYSLSSRTNGANDIDSNRIEDGPAPLSAQNVSPVEGAPAEHPTGQMASTEAVK